MLAHEQLAAAPGSALVSSFHLVNERLRALCSHLHGSHTLPSNLSCSLAYTDHCMPLTALHCECVWLYCRAGLPPSSDPDGAVVPSLEAGEERLKALESGACACVAYVQGRQLCVAGAGDTRCVLGTRVHAHLHAHLHARLHASTASLSMHTIFDATSTASQRPPLSLRCSACDQHVTHSM
jgi:hypothetical protein